MSGLPGPREEGEGLLGRRRRVLWVPHAQPHLFGVLDVHHEVVHVLLCLIKLQLPGHHGHQQGCAADPLWAQQHYDRGLWGSCATNFLPEPSQQPQKAGKTTPG